jgi:hypothetical protein
VSMPTPSYPIGQDAATCIKMVAQGFCSSIRGMLNGELCEKRTDLAL